jgi:hypothetical protein
MEVNGQLHAPAALSRIKITGVHWIGGWVGPRAGLDALEKKEICPFRESNPGCPACSPPLYKPSYPD